MVCEPIGTSLMGCGVARCGAVRGAVHGVVRNAKRRLIQRAHTARRDYAVRWQVNELARRAGKRVGKRNVVGKPKW